jgi:hypothetical protein
MRAVFKRGFLVAALFLASSYCFLGVWAVADLSMPGDPTAARRAYLWLAGSVLLGALGIWQLTLLLKRHGSENLL